MAVTGGNAQTMQQIWAQAVDQVKKEIIAPTLWRAVERTVAVAWEDNTFVIGLASADGQLAGTLHAGEYRSAIERILRGITRNNDLQLRVLEGTNYADWEHTKARDAAGLAQRQQVSQRQYREAAAYASWDEVYDQVSRLWASTELRALASGRARYMDQALGLLEKALETLYPLGAAFDEQNERGLTRVLERIASMTNSDAAVVGYLLLQRRQKKGSS